jgi:hypothetical protein
MKVLVFIAVFGLGCASTLPRLSPQRCPPGGIDPATLAPLGEQPKPLELFIPPLPIPSSAHGQRSTMRVVVDTLGAVMRDSVMVCGITDERYSHQVAEAAAALRFRPRQIAGRSVQSPALLAYDF